MRIIPKYQKGGAMDYFVTYQPLQQPSPQTQGEAAPAKITTSKDSDTGKLTEKDLFSMIKDIDGLPSDMKTIVNNIQNTLSYSSLMGSSSDISSSYLSSLYQIRVANFNKKQFDEAFKTSIEKGGMNEYAITQQGEVVVRDNTTGDLTSISASALLAAQQNGDDQYTALTNSNLLDLRAHSSKYAMNNSLFGIVQNGIGMDEINKMINDRIGTLGKDEMTKNSLMVKDQDAIKQGLAVLQGEQAGALMQQTGMTLDGLYESKLITSTQKNQAESALAYIYSTLPENAKTLLSIKSGNANNPQQGAINILSQMIASRTSSKYEQTYEYKGSTSTAKKGGKGGEGDDEDPKLGFWGQLQRDQGGTETSFNLIMGKGHMSVLGKYYGAAPDASGNMSLTKFMQTTNGGQMSANNKNITFGDKRINSTSWDDVMVNTSAGMMTATLPKTTDGRVDLDILPRYSKIADACRRQAKPGTEKYEQLLSSKLRAAGMGFLTDASGHLDTRKFGHFLVMEGYASSKTKINENNKVSNLEGSSFMQDVSSDDDAFDMVEAGLSDLNSEGKGKKYELDHNWMTLNNDKLFRGNIYVPLNTNTNSAMNADENDIKESTSRRYEMNEQIFRKRENAVTEGLTYTKK